MNKDIDKFLSENGFERDTSRSELGNIITSPRAKKIIGYEQMDYYLYEKQDKPQLCGGLKTSVKRKLDDPII